MPHLVRERKWKSEWGGKGAEEEGILGIYVPVAVVLWN